MSEKDIASFFTLKRKSTENDENPAKKANISTSSLNIQGFCIGNSWNNCLIGEMNKPYFIKLNDFVSGERKSKTIYPPAKDVFSWTQYCELTNVKVIILGQDPYHGPNQAHGLCFSVKLGVNPPPSLVNIFKAVKNDDAEFKIPPHGYLVGWARQGVLMLNAVLTVERSKANAHKGRGWEKLTDHVIKYISQNLKNCVFLLWGKPAQEKSKLIDAKKHLVLKTVHPSPLSAHRGFLESGHFRKANEYLKEHGKQEIDWNDLPEI